MTKILVINASYRAGGITDQTGLIGKELHPQISERMKTKIKKFANKLV